MNRTREKTTATLLIAIFMISILAVIIPVMAKPQSFTFSYDQAQFQWRAYPGRNTFGDGWDYIWPNYAETEECILTGNVLHSSIWYDPPVTELTGSSNVHVHERGSDRWILREGTITYEYTKYDPYTAVNYFRGYKEFDGTPSGEDAFVHGVLYQWIYVDEPQSAETEVKTVLPEAEWDDIMGAWLVGFSIYIQDPDTHTPADFYSEGDAFIPFPSSMSVLPRPVPAKNYNPLDQ